MRRALAVGQIIVSAFLIVLILLQAQGGGSGSVFGGGGGETYHTRKGVEKIIFISTIVGTGLFIIISLISLIN